MSLKILITGATGFVGSQLAARLAALDFDVHVPIRSTSSLWRLESFRSRINFHDCDLGDPHQIQQLIKTVMPNTVFHFACYGSFLDNETDREQILKINVHSSFSLLEACSKYAVEKFIYIGSSSEYGEKLHPISEEEKEKPSNFYAVTKLAASHLVRWYGSQGILPTSILRIFSPYGKYDNKKRLIPSVIEACFKRENIHLTDGSGVRDFIYIEDLVDAFVMASQKLPGQGEILNLGSGQQHSIREVVLTILEEMDHPITPVWGMKASRANEPKCWQADITKAVKLLDWQPKTSLLEGLKDTIAWMRNDKNRVD